LIASFPVRWYLTFFLFVLFGFLCFFVRSYSFLCFLSGVLGIVTRFLFVLCCRIVTVFLFNLSFRLPLTFCLVMRSFFWSFVLNLRRLGMVCSFVLSVGLGLFFPIRLENGAPPCLIWFPSTVLTFTGPLIFFTVLFLFFPPLWGEIFYFLIFLFFFGVRTDPPLSFVRAFSRKGKRRFSVFIIKPLGDLMGCCRKELMYHAC